MGKHSTADGGRPAGMAPDAAAKGSRTGRN